MKLAPEHPQAQVLRLTRVRYGDHDCPQSFEEVVMPLVASLDGLAMAMAFPIVRSSLSDMACRSGVRLPKLPQPRLPEID